MGADQGQRGQRGQRHQEMIEKFDLDQDGQLSESEREAAHAQFELDHPEIAAKRLEQLDTDGDGQISEEERQAGRQQFGPRGRRNGLQRSEELGLGTQLQAMQQARAEMQAAMQSGDTERIQTAQAALKLASQTLRNQRTSTSDQ
jgi:hypothetical protein